MFSLTFRVSGFIVNRKANGEKKRERERSSSALQYCCPFSRAAENTLPLSPSLPLFSHRVKIPRTVVVALCIRYISRAHHRMQPREAQKEVRARRYNIKSTVHLNINEPRWTNTFRRTDEHVIPRVSNSRSPSPVRAKVTIQCRGIMYGISHIYIS